MKLKVANMWDSKDDVLAVTTNATINSSHKLVMGRGAAFQAATKFPKLQGLAASAIEDTFDYCLGGYPIYGFRTVKIEDKEIGLFQVKMFYGDEALLPLIGYSVMSLLYWCSCYPKKTVALNFPGIGNGRLNPENVRLLIDKLPEQITVYALSKERLEYASA